MPRSRVLSGHGLEHLLECPALRPPRASLLRAPDTPKHGLPAQMLWRWGAHWHCPATEQKHFTRAFGVSHAMLHTPASARSGRAQRRPCWPQSQGHSQSPRRGQAGSGLSSHPHTAAPGAGGLPYGSSPTPPPTLSLSPVPPKPLPTHCSKAAKGSGPTAPWAGHPSRARLDPPLPLGQVQRRPLSLGRAFLPPHRGRVLPLVDSAPGAGCWQGTGQLREGSRGTSATYSLEMRKGRLLRLG